MGRGRATVRASRNQGFLDSYPVRPQRTSRWDFLVWTALVWLRGGEEVSAPGDYG